MLSNKRKKPRLKFIPGLALIGLRTTGPWGLTSRGSYIQGSYSQEVLHPGVLQPGGLTSRGLPGRRSYIQGSYSWEVLHVGVPVSRGSYMQGFFCFVF